MARSSRRTRSSSGKSRRSRTRTVFQRRNYLLLLLGVALVVIGFAVMAIDHQFKGFLSLYVAPLLIVGGYLEIIYAILWRPGEAGESKVEG